MDGDTVSEQVDAKEADATTAEGGLRRERLTRGGAAARARADAQRALRARTAALGALADRWAKIDGAKATAARRRDDQVRKATERADARYREALAAAEKTEEEIMRDALALEGATTKEIASWLAIPSRRVNKWRRKLSEASASGAAIRSEDTAGVEESAEPSE